jgi:hypothetical protein
MTACAPFVNMRLLVELFPQYNEITVYRRFRNRKGEGGLPAPDLTVGQVDLWSVETITTWAEATGKELDPGVLARICQTQQP